MFVLYLISVIRVNAFDFAHLEAMQSPEEAFLFNFEVINHFNDLTQDIQKKLCNAQELLSGMQTNRSTIVLPITKIIKAPTRTTPATLQNDAALDQFSNLLEDIQQKLLEAQYALTAIKRELSIIFKHDITEDFKELDKFGDILSDMQKKILNTQNILKSIKEEVILATTSLTVIPIKKINGNKLVNHKDSTKTPPNDLPIDLERLSHVSEFLKEVQEKLNNQYIVKRIKTASTAIPTATTAILSTTAVTAGSASMTGRPFLLDSLGLLHFSDTINVHQKLLEAQNILSEIKIQLTTVTTSASLKTTSITTSATTSVWDYIEVSAIRRTGVTGKWTYFSDSFERFFNLTISKNPGDVMRVLKPGRRIALSMQKKGQLEFLDGPIGIKFHNFLQKISYEPYNYLKIYLSLLHYYMQNRDILCNAEVNDLINSVNYIFDEADGRRLSAVLDEFERFPAILKSGEQLCSDIMEAFLTPLWKKTGTKELKKIILFTTGVITLRLGCSSEERRALIQKELDKKNPLFQTDSDNSYDAWNKYLKKDEDLTQYTKPWMDLDYRIDIILKKHLKTDSRKSIKKDSFPEYTTDNALYKYNIKIPAEVDINNNLLHKQVQSEDALEGYFCLVYEKLTAVLMTKPATQMKQIYKYVEKTLKDMDKNGRLKFLGKLQSFVIAVLTSFFDFRRSDMIKLDAELLYNKMKNRKTEYNSELNAIIDFTNEIITQEHADRIGVVIDDIHRFPIVNKTAQILCKELLYTFAQPFIDLEKQMLFQNFYEAVYTLLRQEYPSLFMRLTAIIGQSQSWTPIRSWRPQTRECIISLRTPEGHECQGVDTENRRRACKERQRNQDEHGCICGCIDGKLTDLYGDQANYGKVKGNGSWLPPDGYFTRSYITFMNLTRQLSDSNYRALMGTSHEVYKRATEKGKMLWLGPTLGSFLFQKTWIWSDLEKVDPDRFKNGLVDINRQYKIARYRDKILSQSECDLFARADRIVVGEDGRYLEGAVQAIAGYTSNLNGTEMVETVFYAFTSPFEKSLHEVETASLLEDVNLALKHRDG